MLAAYPPLPANRLCARAGLPHIRLHDLRHTHATLALEAGVHPRVVQEWLGHSNDGVTLNTYSHVEISLQVDAALKLSLMRRRPGTASS